MFVAELRLQKICYFFVWKWHIFYRIFIHSAHNSRVLSPQTEKKLFGILTLWGTCTPLRP